MLDNLLGSLFWGAPNGEGGQGGENTIAKLLPLIFLFIIILGGLKLFKGKDLLNPDANSQ